MKIAAALIILLSSIVFGNGEFLEPNCGVSVSSNGNVMPMIINGGTADMFGNPWMALIITTNINMISMCGGSLITNRFVLSAAHCTSLSPTNVYLGEFDRSTITDCSNKACMPNAIKIAADAYLAHPNYVHYNRNDIALFRLTTPVQFTAYIKPICLVTDANILDYITYLNATGWGITENGVESQVLKTTTLSKVDRSYCSQAYGYQVDGSHICAWDYTSSTCSGDSGGPILVKARIDGIDRVVQLGIVSYGSRQCRGVGVYTNVFHHMNWIKDAIRIGAAAPTNNRATAWQYTSIA